MPPMRLFDRLENGVWHVVQFLGGGLERTGWWKEPPDMFRDRLGQYCWRTPSGMIFCSDPSGDKRHHGKAACPETLRWIGFEQLGKEPIASPEEENGPIIWD
jgi:hypothetical protein